MGPNSTEIEAEAELVRGMPRPRADANDPTGELLHCRLPVPWISTSNAYLYRDWLTFDDAALDQACEAEYLLCSVCGEELGQEKIFGLLRSRQQDQGRRRTSGTGMHPPCALLAVAYCPHLRRIDLPFAIYRGDGCGIDLDAASRDADNEARPDLSDPPLMSEAAAITLAELKRIARDFSG